MSLSTELGIPEGPGFTALVGGGGKTSLMHRLAEERVLAGRPAVITTTTAIMYPEAYDLIQDEYAFEKEFDPGKVICIGRAEGKDKVRFPGDALMDLALKKAGRVFVEADGAKRMPAKVPAPYEPVIPAGTDSVIAVSGLDALGFPIKEKCFRTEYVCRLLGVSEEEILTPEMLALMITGSEGLRKDVPPDAVFSVLLNKADNSLRLGYAESTAGVIRRLLPGCRVVAASLNEDDCIKKVF